MKIRGWTDCVFNIFFIFCPVLCFPQKVCLEERAMNRAGVRAWNLMWGRFGQYWLNITSYSSWRCSQSETNSEVLKSSRLTPLLQTLRDTYLFSNDCLLQWLWFNSFLEDSFIHNRSLFILASSQIYIIQIQQKKQTMSQQSSDASNLVCSAVVCVVEILLSCYIGI